MAHRFDKATHRCVCGRWERGFKPKAEPVLPRAECQICERQQAVDGSGCLVHHGYRRPGWGFIQGDCMGVGYEPYPKTDALEVYLVAVRGHITRLETRLAEIPTLNEIPYRYTVRVNGKREERVRTIRRGDAYHYDFEERTSFPDFEYEEGLMIRGIEAELAFARDDEKRVAARIAKAKAP
jgi:hypothetical protein